MSVVGGLDLLRPRALRPHAIEAVYAEAWGYDQRLAVDQATLRIGNDRVDAVSVGIARPDVAQRQRNGPWHSPFARTSGMLFAGIVGPFEPGRYPLELELTLADGARITAATNDVIVTARPSQVPAVIPEADVAVVMATHNPAADLFERQIASIKAQEYGSWCCIVCDDASSPQHLAAMRDALAGDSRFVLVENNERLGFYLNFERALELVPAGVKFVALSDQDDIWSPLKLRRQVEALEADAVTFLVASDARIVDGSGRVLSPSFYSQRSAAHADRYSLFVVNNLIGASMMFRRELLDLALPFPRAFRDCFHDHWLARAALAAGAVGFVDDTLHDYVQHDGNVLGFRAVPQCSLWPPTKALMRRLVGIETELPPDWRDLFVGRPLEAGTALRLLMARRADVAPLPALDRVLTFGDGELREFAHIVADHARERCARRPRREAVEFSQFTGRLWGLFHRPGSLL
jgi:hypothetical protein